MNKFNNGKIYKIRSPQTDMVYIGSTTQILCRRMSNHQSKYKGNTNKCSSVKILEFGDAYIELIEDYPCDSKDKLNAREGHHMRTTLNCINKNIAGRTCHQYYIDNATTINQKQSKKYLCNCGVYFTHSNKSRHEKSLKHVIYIHQMKSTK